MSVSVRIRQAGLFASLIAVALVMADPVSSVAEPLDAASAKRANVLLDGVWSSFEKIRSGTLKVTEVTAFGVSEIGPKQDNAEHTQYVVVFDDETGNLRFDFQQAGRRTSFVRNDTEALLWVSQETGGGAMSRHPRDYQVTVHDARPVDFRVAAVTFRPVFRDRWSIERVRKYFEWLRETQLTTFEETGSQIRFGFDFKSEDPNGPTLAGKGLLVLDRDQGLLPVLLEERYEWKEGGWGVSLRTETDWKQISGTWVPQKCKMTSVRNPAVTELTFDWDGVNRPVSKDAFELAGMDASENALVLNHKLGEPVLEGRVAEVVAAEEISQDSGMSVGALLAITSIVQMVGIIGIVAWRKRAGRSPS